jgi:chitinase
MSPKLSYKIIAALIAATFLLIISVSPSHVSTAGSFKIIGYLTSWSGTVAEMQLNKLTHVNYAFVLPNADGSLKPLENPAKLNQLVTAAHANGVKVLISVGGWNDGNDSAFETLAASPAGRTNFTNSMIAMVNQYNLDGVDIDWEYPDPDNSNPDNPQPGSSAHNYYLLMSELSDAMHNRGKLLTAAVVSLGWAVFSKVDFLNLMAYDGGNGSTHSPYQYAVDSINFWRGRGLPAAKTVLGVPFYGRPSWASYRTLIAAGCSPDSDTCNYQGSTVYYNGRPTIRQKTQLALQQAGGIILRIRRMRLHWYLPSLPKLMAAIRQRPPFHRPQFRRVVVRRQLGVRRRYMSAAMKHLIMDISGVRNGGRKGRLRVSLRCGSI